MLETLPTQMDCLAVFGRQNLLGTVQIEADSVSL
jgi:hypothetical protein